MKILFLVPYPLKESPSQRFRFEQYFETLIQAGHSYQVQPFLDSYNWQFFFRSGLILAKSIAIIKGFFKRFVVLFVVNRYDWIFIHREATPIGPPIFEWILARILRKRIIYDFDDAIWLTDRVQEPALLTIVKWRLKVKTICRLSYKVSCGNEYLRRYALHYNPNAIYNPTTIDGRKMSKAKQVKSHKTNDPIIIGWTGSHSTLKYLMPIESVLQKIENQFPQASILIIADQRPTLQLSRITFVKWNAQTELTDLSKMDIGIMPLPDDEWTKGKCGFKALQYMAMEIPALVSPVGVNTSIVDHGVNGFYCSSDDEWIQYLSQLIRDKSLREQMGKKGKEKVINQFSVASNTDNFLSLFS